MVVCIIIPSPKHYILAKQDGGGGGGGGKGGGVLPTHRPPPTCYTGKHLAVLDGNVVLLYHISYITKCSSSFVPESLRSEGYDMTYARLVVYSCIDLFIHLSAFIPLGSSNQA
jgi:hypothetical protein